MNQIFMKQLNSKWIYDGLCRRDKEKTKNKHTTATEVEHKIKRMRQWKKRWKQIAKKRIENNENYNIEVLRIWRIHNADYSILAQFTDDAQQWHWKYVSVLSRVQRASENEMCFYLVLRTTMI